MIVAIRYSLATRFSRRAARPWVGGERNCQLGLHSFRSEGLQYFAVELALDHGVHELGAEAWTPVPFVGRAVSFLPIEQQGQSLLGSPHRPGDLDPAQRRRK